MQPTHAARLLGASLRLTRLIVTDDVPGQWWIKTPLYRKAIADRDRTGKIPAWAPYLQGLDCPFCIGLWVAFGVAAVDEVAGESRAWRAFTTGLALNEAAGHLAARLGDLPDDDDDSDSEGAGTP